MQPLVELHTFSVRTERAPQFLDITEKVKETVEGTGIKQGIVTVFTRHTTAAIRINENEPLLLADMEEFLKRLAPKDLYYRHNDFEIRTQHDRGRMPQRPRPLPAPDPRGFGDDSRGGREARVGQVAADLPRGARPPPGA